MSETEVIVMEHAARYPSMQPQDVVKLLYQNEFGAGHFVTDGDKSRERIIDEFEAAGHDRDLPLFERIGNEYVRCHIDSRYMREEDITCLNRAFLLSAHRTSGNMASFQKKLSALYTLAEEGVFCFGRKDLESYLRPYESDGFPAVSHSSTYREAYHPSYRVIGERLCRLFPLISEIERLQKNKRRVTVAIDGRCTAGKTSAAGDIAEMFQGEVIHMDDFFLPPKLRTKERYEQAGGNVHYERFQKEVLDRLASGKEFSYRVFSCRKMDYDETKTIRGDGVVIVEGAYSNHPVFGNPYDLTVFFDVEEEEQKRRIIQRDGKEHYFDFEKKWIPLEEKYINSAHICEKCRIVVR